MTGINSIAVAAIAGLCAAAMLAPSAQAQPRLTASFLPQERNVRVDAPSTHFATLVNYGDAAATNCRVVPVNGIANADLAYYQLDGSLNVTGPANPPMTLDAGQSATLLLDVRSRVASTIDENTPISFVCDEAGFVGFERNGVLATRFNTGGEADVIAIGSTLSGDQVMRAPGAGRRAVMAVAAINIGEAQRMAIRPWPAQYPRGTHLGSTYIEVSVCETGPDARCLADPVDELPFEFGANEVRTFNVYARATEPNGVPLQPAYNRVHVSIEPPNAATDRIGFTRQTNTSAAFYSPPETPLPVGGNWTYIARADMELDNPGFQGIHDGSVYIVPRPQEFAADGDIVIFRPGGDPADVGNVERVPTRTLEIDWRYPRGDSRVVTFDPHVQVERSEGYRYYYPLAAPPWGNLNFRTEDRGGGLVSPRWRQFWTHQNCTGFCRPNDSRLDWTYEIAGIREDRLNTFGFANLPVEWVEIDNVLGTPTGRWLTIRSDGTVEGFGDFYTQNFGTRLDCPFSGRIYDTVPGSTVFYVRMTVPETARCETDGFPPAAPYIEDEYEGALVLTPTRVQNQDRWLHTFYVWTMDWPIPEFDRSYHTFIQFSVGPE